MKTTEQINQEISDIIASIDGLKESEKKRLKKRIALLKQYKLYLESNPREDFLKESKNLIEKRINFIKDNFQSWIPPNGCLKPLNMYKKETGLPLLISQLDALKYLLK